MTIDDRVKDQKLQYDINREAAKILALSSGKIHKYGYLTGAEILPSEQRREIEQAKFIYSPLEKAFEKHTKTIDELGRKQIDAITNQNERLAVLTNKDDHNYKEIFEKLVKERFDEIKELTNEINHDDLAYYFTGNTARKRFDDFNNSIKLFRKIQSDEMKLGEAKKLQNVFKSNLNKVSKGRYKSEEQKCTLENIKLLYKSLEAAFKLFSDYSSIVSEAKYKTLHGKRITSISACVPKVYDRKVSNCNVSDHSNLKILSPKQML